MGLLDKFSAWASGAPVHGEITRANVRELLQDGSTQGHMKKYVDPKMLVEGQSYAMVQTAHEGLHGEPLIHVRWGRVLEVSKDLRFVTIDTEYVDGLTGDRKVQEEMHSVRDVSKAILNPDSERRYDLGHRESPKGPFARRQFGG